MIEKKEFIFSTNNDWIKYADQKATILISVYGILITIVYTNPKEILESVNTNICTQITFGLTLILVAVSIFNAFRAMYPRITNNNPDTSIFFGHISKMENWGNYKEQFPKDNSVYEDQLTEQIHSNAIICTQKFTNIKTSVLFFGLAMVLIVIQIIAYLFL